jgi:hypothetical protein
MFVIFQASEHFITTLPDLVISVGKRETKKTIKPCKTSKGSSCKVLFLYTESKKAFLVRVWTVVT